MDFSINTTSDYDNLDTETFTPNEITFDTTATTFMQNEITDEITAEIAASTVFTQSNAQRNDCFQRLCQTQSNAEDNSDDSDEEVRKAIALATERVKQDKFFDFSYLFRMREFNNATMRKQVATAISVNSAAQQAMQQAMQQTQATAISVNSAAQQAMQQAMQQTIVSSQLYNKYCKAVDYGTVRFHTANTFFITIFGFDLKHTKLPLLLQASTENPANINFEIPLTKLGSITTILRFLNAACNYNGTIPRDAKRNFSAIVNYVVENIHWIISLYNAVVSKGVYRSFLPYKSHYYA